MKSTVLTILSALTTISLFSCGKSVANTQNASSNEVLEYKLPTIPDSLTEPIDRLRYMALHYWDLMDFTNQEMSLDTLFMEQAFSDYIDLMDYLPDHETSEKSVEIMLSKASSFRPAYKFLSEISDKYLYDIESPFINYTLFQTIANDIVRNKILDETDLAIWNDRIEELKIAAIGSKAPDAVLIDNNGKSTSISQLIDGASAILIFYDSSCRDCLEIIDMMDIKQMPYAFIPDIKVISIDISENRKSHSMPNGWIDTYASDIDNLPYITRAKPSIYVITDGIITQRDLPYNQESN